MSKLTCLILQPAREPTVHLYTWAERRRKGKETDLFDSAARAGTYSSFVHLSRKKKKRKGNWPVWFCSPHGNLQFICTPEQKEEEKERKLTCLILQPAREPTVHLYTWAERRRKGKETDLFDSAARAGTYSSFVHLSRKKKKRKGNWPVWFCSPRGNLQFICTPEQKEEEKERKLTCLILQPAREPTVHLYTWAERRRKGKETDLFDSAARTGTYSSFVHLSRKKKKRKGNWPVWFCSPRGNLQFICTPEQKEEEKERKLTCLILQPAREPTVHLYTWAERRRKGKETDLFDSAARAGTYSSFVHLSRKKKKRKGNWPVWFCSPRGNLQFICTPEQKEEEKERKLTCLILQPAREPTVHLYTWAERRRKGKETDLFDSAARTGTYSSFVHLSRKKKKRKGNWPVWFCSPHGNLQFICTPEQKEEEKERKLTGT